MNLNDKSVKIAGKTYKITKLRQVACMMFACFPFKWNNLTIHNSNLSHTEGHIPQIDNIIMDVLGGPRHY